MAVNREFFLQMLSPGITLVNRLSFAGKFLLLGLFAICATGTTLYGVYSELNESIRHSRKELEGLSIIEPLARAIQLVQQHRGLSAGALGGMSDSGQVRAANEAAIDAALANLEKTLPPNSRQLESWKGITGTWKNIRTSGMQWTVEGNFSVHTHLIEKLLLYETGIMDDYGLTSESDLEIFYLARALGKNMMSVLEHLGQIRAHGTVILGAKQMTERQKMQINTLIVQISDDFKSFNTGIGHVARYRTGTQQIVSGIYGRFQESSRQMVDKVYSDILNEHFSTPSVAFFASATKAIDSGYQELYDQMLPATRGLIQAHLRHTEAILYAMVGLTLLLLLLVAYLTAAIYHSTLGSIRTLSRSVNSFVSGNMQGRVGLKTHDELSQIGESFNRMADEVEDLIRAKQEVMDTLIERERDLQLTQFSVDHAGDGMFWTDTEGRFLSVNENACRSLGYSSEELVGMFIWDVNPNFPSSGWEAFFARLKKEGPLLLETQLRRKNGAMFPVEISASYVCYGGREYGFAFARDITGRKKIEHALSESEEKFRRIFEDAADPVLLLKGGRFIDCNRAALELLRYPSKEQFINSSPSSISPPRQPDGRNSAEKSAEMDATALREGFNQFEWEHTRFDGSTVLVEVTLTSIYLEGERILHVLWHDITERKQNEAKIERLSRIYRLLGQVNEAIVRTRDRGELFKTVCHSAVESGLFRFVWIGMLDERRIVVEPVAHAGVEEGYTAKLNIRLDDERTGAGPTGRAIRGGAYVICADIENDPSMAPWRDEALKRGYRASAVFPVYQAGHVAGAINVYAIEANFFTPDIIQLMWELAADISFALDVFAEKARRESAENELRLLNTRLESRVLERTSQLEAANRELESFSYSVSHDLRAPLRSIDGFGQILLKKYHGSLDETGRDYLARVCRASQRMGHLIDDMLQLSRVARSPLKRELVDLSVVAGEVAEELRQSCQERKIEFILQQGLSAYADSGLMRIVLDNLLSNACKYSSKKAEAKIEFGTCDVDGVNAFFVRDNGAGFSMEHAHKLFGAFQRLHGTDEFEGTGVGLATVQRVIQRHHGKVWAEAREGEGATFYFTLPQRERDMEPA